MTPTPRQVLAALAVSVAAHFSMGWYASTTTLSHAAESVQRKAMLVALTPPDSAELHLEAKAATQKSTEPKVTPRVRPLSRVEVEPRRESHPLRSEKPDPALEPEAKPEVVTEPAKQPIVDKESPTAATNPSPSSSASASPPTTGQREPRQDSPQLGRAIADYTALVRTRIARARTYPMNARRLYLEGDVAVSFVIDSDGRVNQLRIATGSQHHVLNRAALELTRAVSPLPEPPTSPFPIAVTLRYTLEG